MQKTLAEDSEQKIVVGLDIGTTKICAVAGKYDNEKNIQIIGVGVVKSEGLKKGVITDIDAAEKAIRSAVHICEQKAGVQIENVYVGITGQHIKGKNTNGVVAVKGDHISEADVDRVIESAKAHDAGSDDVIHTLLQEYIVDGQDGVKNPIGMAGKRLQAKTHIIFGSSTATNNLHQSCDNAGLEINKTVAEPLASAFSSLSKDEKELGVILLDIGGGTTDVIIYKNNGIVQTAVIPIGGNHITDDITVGLRTPRDEAIRLKHSEGTALERFVEDGETIRVSGIQNRPERVCDKKILGFIIEARMREIFEWVNEIIKTNKYASVIGAGVVLTGGASLMRNIDILSDEILELQSRVASPLHITGLPELVSSPIYSTAVGLVKYGLNEQTDTQEIRSEHSDRGINGYIKSGMNAFFKKFF